MGRLSVVAAFGLVCLAWWTPAMAQAAKCRIGSPCYEGWIAASGFGDSASFFRSSSGVLTVAQLTPGMEVATTREINVRNAPAGWESINFELPRGSRIRIDRIGVKTKQKSSVQQRWVFFRSPPADEAAMSSKIRPAKVPKQSEEGAPFPEGIWWERPAAEMTGGYDGPSNRTLIHSYNVAVRGPSSVEASIRDAAEACVSVAGGAGFAAFKATPSPEIGARLGAAWGAFKGSLATCFSGSSIQMALLDQFEVVYIRRVRYAPGLNLRFSVSNPTTEIYGKMHDLVKGNLPDPINRVIQFAIASQDFPEVNISLQPPEFLRPYSAEVPDVKQLQKFRDGYEAVKQKNLPALADLVKNEIQNEAGKWVGDASGKAASELQGAMVRIQGQAADALKSMSPDAAMAKLFSQLGFEALGEGPARDALCLAQSWLCPKAGGGKGGGVTPLPCPVDPTNCPNPFSLSAQIADKGLKSLPTLENVLSKGKALELSKEFYVLGCKGDSVGTCRWIDSSELSQFK